jgi:hypothetical protein
VTDPIVYFNFDYAITEAPGKVYSAHRARVEGEGITVGPALNEEPFPSLVAAQTWLKAGGGARGLRT